LFLFAFQIKLPSLVNGTLSAIGAMIGPNAMLIAGMLIVAIPVHELLGNKRVYLVSFLRLIDVPLCLLLILKQIDVTQWVAQGDKIMMISFLATMSPSAAVIIQMAVLFKRDANKASAIYGVTTVLCIITMPLIIALYQFL